MNVLAFDVALRACSVAVMVDGRIEALCFEERARGHAEVLIPMIEKACGKSGIALGNIDQIAVTVGPGTFAGVRIGIAAARGLAISLGIPIVGLTTLEAVAAGALPDLRDDESHVTAVFDARRGQVYVQSFDSALRALAPPQATAPEVAIAALPVGAGIIIGDGIAVLGEALTRARDDIRVATGLAQPDAAVVARLASGRAAARPNSGAPAPVYLRPPDARLPAAPRQDDGK